jgi:hypothetical protein
MGEEIRRHDCSNVNAHQNNRPPIRKPIVTASPINHAPTDIVTIGVSRSGRTVSIILSSYKDILISKSSQYILYIVIRIVGRKFGIPDIWRTAIDVVLSPY